MHLKYEFTHFSLYNCLVVIIGGSVDNTNVTNNWDFQHGKKRHKYKNF